MVTHLQYASSHPPPSYLVLSVDKVHTDGLRGLAHHVGREGEEVQAYKENYLKGGLRLEFIKKTRK